MKKTLFTTTFAALSVACAGAADAGVVAHYSFDTDYTDSAAATGGGTLTETENSGATVAINNSAGNSVFGGGAADFSSTVSDEAYLNLATAINFGATDAWSTAFWVRRPAGTDNRQGMVLGDTANNTDFIWRSNNSNQVEGLRFRNSSNQTADFGGFPDDNTFEHWAVVSDGSGTISTYRNGVKQTDVSQGGDFNITAVGHAYTLTTQSMNGQIDELYIFDEAIDSATVNSLFTSNVVPEPGSLALLGLGGLCALRRRR